MSKLSDAAAIMGRKGGQAGTGSAKARASEDMRKAASQRWGTVEQRFWRKVVKQDGDGCWEWIGGTNEHGYGVFWYEGRLQKAPRVSLKLHGCQIPEGAHVLHKCDNPPCIRPDHLFTGSHSENMADAVKKGRTKQGERHWRSKLTEQQVREIRAQHKKWAKNHGDLATRYGVSVITIRHVLYGRGWKHVKSAAAASGQSQK